MAATKYVKPFRYLATKRLSSLIAAMGSSYNGIFSSKAYVWAEGAESFQ